MPGVYGRRRFYKRPYKKTVYNKAKKTVTAKKAVSSNRRSNFNKRVLSVINRNSETKMKVVSLAVGHSIYGQGLLATSQNQGSGHSGYIIPNLLGTNLMEIFNGTEQEQKIGNKIRDARLIVSGCIKAQPYNATSNPYISPFEIHMVCYKSKSDPEGNPLQLKNKPSNQTGTCDGTLENTLYPYNRDKYLIHKVRVFKLRGFRPTETLNATDVIYETGGQSSTLPSFVRFRCECPISNKVIYQDGQSVPSNTWCSLAFFVVDRMNNTITDTHTRAEIWLDGKITFKDD